MAQSEIDKVRALLRSNPRPVGWAERRQRLDDIGSVWPVADDVKLETVDVDGVPGEWSIAPNSDFSRVLMFFHGGGYCSGSIVSHRRMVTEAGRAAGMRTLAVAYRLAPEHPFPAAYDDALTAWRFLRNEGIPSERIAVGGDSAGAALAMALIGRLRDGHEKLPVCACLVSPWTDLTMSGSTFASKNAVDPIIHKEYLYELVDAYLPAGVERNDPYAQGGGVVEDRSIRPGTRVEVRSGYRSSWTRGFEVARVEGDAYVVRRVSDGTVLPAAFDGGAIRQERRPDNGFA